MLRVRFVNEQLWQNIKEKLFVLSMKQWFIPDMNLKQQWAREKIQSVFKGLM